MHSEKTHNTLHGYSTGAGPYVSIIRPKRILGAHISASWTAKIYGISDEE